VNKDNGEVVCKQKICKVNFPVGETILTLSVTDTTGDSASDEIKVKVLPKSEATSPPKITSISPDQGPAVGGNMVTITGDFLYADSEIFFGKTKSTSVKHIDIKTILATAPEGEGMVDITVVSNIGTSNVLTYDYQSGGEVPVNFELKTWTTPGGGTFTVEEVTCITIGGDHRYYMGSLTGYVTIASVGKDLVVTKSCKGAFMGAGRSITGIGFNPLDPKNRVFVSTNTHFHKTKGQEWNNAKIEEVYPNAKGCPERGATIISGLPVSNHDHGTNSIIFSSDGKMLIAVGSSSNAGASTPEDAFGGVPESPFSGSIVEADYLRPGFNGIIEYDQIEDPANSNVKSGDVNVFAYGLRNCFGMVLHANGQVYANDNGPNVNFGLTSTSCTTEEPDAESDDKLLRVVRGVYYGHPNRNRGRKNKNQCVYKNSWEPTGKGFIEPMGWMASSTNGIIDYRANTFQGAIRGDLFMSKASFEEEGVLYRAELTDNGEWLDAGPYQFLDRSALSLVQGLYGELVMVELRKYSVLAYQPSEPIPASVQMTNVYPTRGPKTGGNVIMVTGHHLNIDNTIIMVGDTPCTEFTDVSYDSIKCTVPPGNGKVQVTVIQGEFQSTGYGHDYEYFSERKRSRTSRIILWTVVALIAVSILIKVVSVSVK